MICYFPKKLFVKEDHQKINRGLIVTLQVLRKYRTFSRIILLNPSVKLNIFFLTTVRCTNHFLIRQVFFDFLNESRETTTKPNLFNIYELSFQHAVHLRKKGACKGYFYDSLKGSL